METGTIRFLVPAARAAPKTTTLFLKLCLLFLPAGKPHDDSGAIPALKIDRPPHLVTCQPVDELEAEGLHIPDIKVRGDADPVITDRELAPVVT
jgi:hypothetical protein